MTNDSTNLRRVSIASLAAFPATFLAHDLISDEYHPVAETVSRYVNTSTGWLTVVGLLCASAGAALTAWQLRPASRGGRIGRVLLWVFAAAVFVAALAPADPPGNWSSPSMSELVHGQVAMVAFLSFPAAAVLLSRDHRRAGALAWTTVAAAAIMMVTLVDVMTGRVLGFGGFPTLLGLTERIALVSFIAWMITMLVARRPARS